MGETKREIKKKSQDTERASKKVPKGKGGKNGLGEPVTRPDQPVCSGFLK